MSEDQFTKLFKYLGKRFDKVDSQFSDAKTEINQIFNKLDSIEKQLEITEDERLVMGHQLERLDRWVHEVADKIGHKLTV